MKNKSHYNTLLILYYLFLFVLETPLLFSIGVPSTAIRIVYLFLIIVPIYIFDKSYLPFVIFASYSISKFGTAVTLMPTELLYYVPIFLLMAFPFKKFRKGLRPIPFTIFVLSVCVLFVDLIMTGSVHDIFICLFILIILFSYCFPKVNEELFINYFSYIFIVISVILSLEIIFADNRFIENYGYTDMERVMWADPNYLGGVIGMGCLAAAVLLYRKIYTTFNLFILLALLLMVAALVINASRGALLAVICGLATMMMGREIKVWKKIFILFIAFVFIIMLYNNSYFDLLLYRVENDSGGGSGRLDIWMIKWNAYKNNSSLLQLIFGMGFDNGYKAGFSYNRAFHNDFLAFLVDYGIVGFISFVSMFFSPLKGVFLKEKTVLGCIVFLLIICLTLEPFCLGVLLYYYFWMYIKFISLNIKKSKRLPFPQKR